MKLVLTLLLASTEICAVYLIYYAYKRRNMPGAKNFIFLLITAIVYNGGYLCELNSNSFHTAKVWFDIEHLAIPLQHYFWLMLSLEYIQLNKKKYKIIRNLAFFHPILFYSIYFIPYLNRFYILSYRYENNGSFNAIITEKGSLFYVLIVSGTIFGLVSSAAYISGYFKTSRVQRQIYLIMMIATIFPWMSIYLNIYNEKSGIDFFPFLTIVTGVLYIYGIFQFKIFQKIPIALKMVFEQTQEAIILMDMEQKIIDVNESAKNIYSDLNDLKKKNKISDFVEVHPELMDLLLQKEKFQYQLNINGNENYFQVEVKDIQTDDNIIIGKMVEINDITNQYLEQIKLENIVKEAIYQVEISEISLLQAQISPHFINNSLSVIASMITRAPSEAKEMITDLGEYLANCYYFDSSTPMVSLEKEIESVNTYVNIEKARFRERLQFEIISEKIPNIMVPKLILQPLVENAICHGILKKWEGGNINLFITYESHSVSFKIEDDGIGIAKEKLSDLLINNNDKKGIGVLNIHRRLLKYYGEGLTIKSIQGVGTTVSFRIPFQKEKDEELND